MKWCRYLFVFLFLFSVSAWAQDPPEGLQLAKAPIDRSDMESIKRGAKFVATTCLACHTLVYLRYDKLSQDAGITYEKMPVNVTVWPLGVKPPDLSLEANVRGVDWIYTYLHSFYQDSSRPTGMNNLLVPGTAMSGILAPYQGDQVLVEHPMYDLLGHVEWYDLLELKKQGSMTPEQFDAMTADVVNYLAYASEPYRAEQHKIGWWVLGFLLIFTVFAYFLKKEYWKDVKKYQWRRDR
ncbi:MAG TPA: cytochrome c1 [Gammaproteobacteria bacterium]|jgi:ubiquinol-cytochrome c reductase cytochrome c1 subunit|nr:cytochrome c1 [Gammaproteobacteria bacterium]